MRKHLCIFTNTQNMKKEKKNIYFFPQPPLLKQPIQLMILFDIFFAFQSQTGQEHLIFLRTVISVLFLEIAVSWAIVNVKANRVKSLA